MQFILLDGANPQSRLERGIDGKPKQGDYFNALSSRLGPEYSTFEMLEVVPPQQGLASAISYHKGGTIAVTEWSLIGGSWKANLLLLNASREAVDVAKRRVLQSNDTTP